MDVISDKIDASLQLALQLPTEELEKSGSLSAGYEKESQSWELILRLAGSVQTLRQAFPQASFQELSGGYVTALVPEDAIEALAAQDSVIYIEQPKRIVTGVAQGVRASCIWPLQQEMTPVGPLSGRGIFVAIIDSGIDYFHPDFRNADGSSRIAWLFADGKEYSKAQIDQALAAEDCTSALSLVPVTDPSGHGTHVAGIAAGNGRASGGRNRGVAYESPLIVVKLGTARSGGFPLTTQLMEAVEYVKRKSIEERKPVAINISFGNNYGSHTGTSLLETYLSQVANQWKMAIAIGTGNEGQEALHQQGRLSAFRQELGIELAVDVYETSVNLQFWKRYQDVVDLVLLAPDQSQVFRFLDSEQGVGEGQIASYVWNNTEIHVFFDAPSPYQIYQEIYFAFLPRTDYVDAGVWTIRLLPRRIKDGSYALWLQTGGSLNENTGFLQASEETTLTVPSTADKVISVGAYDSRRNQYASFSGRGFAWVTGEVKPDLVAPGVDITSCAPGGGYVTRSGTSMATPFVTGSAALIMQWGILEGNDSYAYGEKLKAYLLRGALPLLGEPMPSERTGWGKLCLRDSLE